MERVLLLGLGLMLCACAVDSIPNVSRVEDNARYYSTKVQNRSDEAARACLRATTEAAGACSEVLDRLHRNKSVSSWLYRRLSKADTAMQQACSQFR